MLNAIKANNMITFGYFNRYMPVQNPSSYSLNISCRHCALDSTNQNQPAKIHQQLSQGKIQDFSTKWCSQAVFVAV